jgi:VanZ family protein
MRHSRGRDELLPQLAILRAGRTSKSDVTRARIALGALAYAALVAHLLFIPYLFSPLPFEETLRRLAHLPWLKLGSDQNVALASRALMFAPLGFLLAAWVAPQPQRRIEFPAFLVAILLGGLWAIAVTAAQLWFPTRTVSLNNLAAELLGVTGGALLWSTLGAVGLSWWRRLASGGRISVEAVLNGYAVLYVVASLTPFDFVTSADELSEKAASGLYGFWTASISCGPAPCTLKFASAALAAIPCGWWFVSRRRRADYTWVSAVPFALAFATIIELLHFLMVSGVSQGASVVARASGILIGAATFSLRHRLQALDLDRLGRPIVLALLAPYAVTLAYVAGWFRAPRLGFAAGIARLDDVIWLPFFYQYYAPYQATMYSTIVHVGLYAPIGAACWLWTRDRDRVPLWRATLLAVLVAAVAETSKVFLSGRLPDYADVFIAAVSATLVLSILRLTFAQRHAPEGALADPHPDPSERSPIAATNASPGARVGGVLLLAVALYSVIGFPVGFWLLGLGLACYAALMLRFPTATYLIAVPLLLPVLDLAPISGRFFWDEMDVLLAVTLGVRLLTLAPVRQPQGPVPSVALWLMFVSVAASAVIGVWPIATVDANAFSSYLSSYNALRVAKGYVWAAVLLWLMRRDAADGRQVVPPLQLGLALGLLAATISVFWERALFVGSYDPGAVFRASGFVSATHVGGAYLEAMLVMLTPFGLGLAVAADRRFYRPLWFVVVLSGALAVLMTLSRAAVLAWLIVVAMFALVWWLKTRLGVAVALEPRRQWLAGGALFGLAGVAVLAAYSSQLNERLATSASDLSVRVAHWKKSIDLVRSDPTRMFLGFGLGSFPREFYLAHAWTQQLPGYRLERDAGSAGSYLVLTGGHGLYMDQRVAAKPGGDVRLRGLIRSPQPGARLSVFLCEKSYLNAVSCDGTDVAAGPQWQPFDVHLSSPRRAVSRLAPAAPLSLSLHNAAYGTRVEVTRLSLVDAGAELLSNGSFEHGLDRWFMTSDVHLAWRTLNTAVEIVFEQGALGILAWLALGLATVTLVLGSRGFPAATAAFAAAATGFVAIGCFDSLLDSPRMILLVGFVWAVALFSSRATEPSHSGPPRESTN